MKYFIISDIHANYSALERVLNIIKRKSISRVVVLGDLVGYGGDPNRVVSRIRGIRNVMVIRGNHDKVASGVEDGLNFNNSARKAAFWTKDKLTSVNRKYLEKLPSGAQKVDGKFEIVHGSTTHEDHYILSDYDASRAKSSMDLDICFFGHSHLPVVFEMDGDSVRHYIPKKDREDYYLKEKCKYFINPGSVGQPRDRNSKASCLVYDSDNGHIRFYRAGYNIEKVARSINRAGLPDILAERLTRGE